MDVGKQRFLTTLGFVDGTSAAAAFTPISITGLQAWLKSDVGTVTTYDGVTVSGDTDPVGKWADQSGNNNHFTQDDEAARPTFNANSINGYPTIDFDGIDNFMKGDSLVPVFDGDDPDYSIVWVGNMAETNAKYIFSAGHTNPAYASTLDGWRYLTGSDGISHARGGLAATVASQGVTTSNSIWVFEHADAASRFFYNGVLKFNEALNSADPQINMFTMGCLRYSTNGNFMDADVAEVMIFNKKLSNAELNSLGDYLSVKYGLSWTTVA